MKPRIRPTKEAKKEKKFKKKVDSIICMVISTGRITPNRSRMVATMSRYFGPMLIKVCITSRQLGGQALD